MKKVIIIYLIGVLMSLVLSFKVISNKAEKYERPLNYGDIGFCITMSIFSWVNIAAACIILISDSDFWDTPIINKEKVISE